MESLAFIHTAVSYEDTSPDRELKVFENVDLSVSGPALMGLAGAAVAVSVLGGTPGKATAATAPVGPGKTGSEVQAIQKALGIAADGNYGAKTKIAVMDFQIRQGLSEIDGVAGKETAKALGLDEQYRPVGFVETCSGCGLNIRSGPGVGYYIVGGAPDGAYLYQDYETVVYNEGYVWTPLYTGGWVASDYTTDDDYYPVSYGCGYESDCGYEESDCGYESDCGGHDDYYPVSYGGCGEYSECGGWWEEEDSCGDDCYEPYPISYHHRPCGGYYPSYYHEQDDCGCS